jgi:hypothetical protein
LSGSCFSGFADRRVPISLLHRSARARLCDSRQIWSGWLVTIQRPPRPKRGALPTELHPVESGAHGRTRTSICNSDYGSPVRSRRRLRARCHGATKIAANWLPSQESNLPELCLTGSRVRLARLTGMNWWSDRVTLPAPVACKASVQPSAHPMVPRVGFEPTSSVLQADVWTTITIWANWSDRPVTIRRPLVGSEKLYL